MAPDTTSAPTPVTYSRFACIGAGFSGIGLGATLKRWYGITDIRIFERHDHVGGTWYANRYPGAGCDIPSALYSLSYESNPDWSRVLPLADELREYLVGVAEKYDLLTRTTLGTEVVRCEWLEGMAGESKEEARGGRWKMTLRNVKTREVFSHECQFLFSGTGLLVKPRHLDIPGAASFKGRIIHSTCLRGTNEDGSYQGIDDNGNKVDIEIKNQKVIVIGNGCTGTQIVPTIVSQASHVTHLVRSKHWLVPSPDGKNLPALRFMLRWIPGAMLLQRILVTLILERFIKAYPLTEEGQRFRDTQRAVLERYMRKKAPEKYHDQLIPDFEVGCKRRVFDTGYLECLHTDGVTLTNEKALEIVPEGIRTAKGVIEADLIILAIGFQTNSPLHGIEIVGRGGKTLATHWDSFGGPGAYNCTIMNGFPNFFLLLGPNTVNGHSSSVIASENSINYSLRIIKPILNGQASEIEVHEDAEKDFVDRVQVALRKTVWHTGCGNWYERGSKGQEWNGSTYPWPQVWFWYDCLFPKWRHLEYSGPSDHGAMFRRRIGAYSTVMLMSVMAAGAWAWKSKLASR